MNEEELQQQLKVVYGDWKHSLHFEDEKAKQLSPPLLLSVGPDYADAKRRIAVFGQETYGWGWGRAFRTSFPEYEIDYPYLDIKTMRNFLANDDSVEALCWAYRTFNFSEHQPENWRSPFWRAFREVKTWPDAGLIWNNLSRCDYDSKSILKAPENLQAKLSECQRELVATELTILDPQVCLFFTGPRYDSLLSTVFPGCRNEEIVPNIPVRRFARIRHPSLPTSSFRTYHPGYLNRSGQWDSLTKLRELVLADLND